MYKDYEMTEHTADIGIKAFGKTKKELFTNIAKGMFFLIADSPVSFKKTSNRKYYKIEEKASSLEDLLVSWLNDLLYIHHTEYVFCDDFIIKSLTKTFVSSEIGSLKIEETHYQVVREIKAVTYHGLQILKNKKGQWEATIIFDI